MKRIFALILSFALLLSCLVLPAGAMFDPSPIYQVQAQSAYIVNTDTNIIVYEKDSTKQVSAGGLTKYMTIALVLTNYADQLDSTFTMPFAISDYVHNSDNADMRSGETFTYREALYAMVTRNANEAAMGLAYELSGGEQQMLAIGRAMMSNPKLLMLDEPSLGLSPVLTEKIFELVLEIQKQGYTIILVEQNAVMALSIADRAYALQNGRITATGTGESLLASAEIVNSYLG